MSAKEIDGRCLRCGAKLVPASMGGIRLMIEPSGSSVLRGRRSRVDLLACSECGHVEMLARNPELFAEDHRGHTEPGS